MARHAHEFQCTVCSWWNRPWLSEKMDGNYTIKCGNCAHEHYRVIVGGVVTEDRHNHAIKHGDTIHVLKSQCSKEKIPEQKKGAILKFREMVAAGLAK